MTTPHRHLTAVVVVGDPVLGPCPRGAGSLTSGSRGRDCAMSSDTGPTSEAEVPALRQEVVDELVHHRGPVGGRWPGSV